jgi:hypothetical protein
MATLREHHFSGDPKDDRGIHRQFSASGAFARQDLHNSNASAHQMLKTYAFSAAVFFSLGIIFLTYA